MTAHDDVSGDRTHYHGDGCTPPHPAAALADALYAAGNTRYESVAVEVLRLLASPDECPVDLSIAAIQYALLYDENWCAAVADAVAANPERYGLEWIATTDVNSPEPELHYRFARRDGADQEGRDDGA